MNGFFALHNNLQRIASFTDSLYVLTNEVQPAFVQRTFDDRVLLKIDFLNKNYGNTVYS